MTHPYFRVKHANALEAVGGTIKKPLMRSVPAATSGGAHNSSLMDVARGYLDRARPKALNNSVSMPFGEMTSPHAPHSPLMNAQGFSRVRPPGQGLSDATRQDVHDVMLNAHRGAGVPQWKVRQGLEAEGISHSKETAQAFAERSKGMHEHAAAQADATLPLPSAVRGSALVAPRGSVSDPNMYKAWAENVAKDPRHYAPGGGGDYFGQVVNAGGHGGLSRATGHSGRDYASEVADIGKEVRASFPYRLGALLAARRYKFASSVPGLSTPDEIAAEERAHRLVPMPLTGPLADRGYAEAVDSPGAMPAPPPPSNGASYSPEERAIIMRTALGRMGNVMRDHVDRENLAAGGHLRVASAPWTSSSMAEPTPNEAGSTRTEYSPERRGEGNGLDGFTLADIGAGLKPSPRAAPAATQGGRKLETYTAEEFGNIAKKDAQTRAKRAAEGPDPLADRRTQQREWGHSSTDDGFWQSVGSTVNADASASPATIIGARP